MVQPLAVRLAIDDDERSPTIAAISWMPNGLQVVRILLANPFVGENVVGRLEGLLAAE